VLWGSKQREPSLTEVVKDLQLEPAPWLAKLDPEGQLMFHDGQPLSAAFLLSSAEQLSVVFEPFGDELVVKPDNHLRVLVYGSQADPVEVRHSPGCISVWASPEAVVHVWNKAGEHVLRY
jgi:hypothetical protein